MGPSIFHKSIYEGLDFIQVAEGMSKKCDARDFKLFVGIIRRLWQRRNDFVHEGSFSHPNSILKQVVEGLEARLISGHKEWKRVRAFQHL
jgi:hypothetical protein